MNTKSSKLILALTFLFLFGSSTVYAGDFQDGLDAHQRQDYKTAFEKWKPLAEQGNAIAQVLLGAMYATGQGVPQDYKEAVKWYRLSAEQGDASAQFNLGRMYYQGLGVTQDYTLSHMWWNICGSSGDENCVEKRNIIEGKMSPSQTEKAQEMARNWKPTTK